MSPVNLKQSLRCSHLTLTGLRIAIGGTNLLPLSKSIATVLTNTNMTDKEKREQVQQTLDYMIAEGMVKKVKGGYRLKTERELEEEMALLDA